MTFTARVSTTMLVLAGLVMPSGCQQSGSAANRPSAPPSISSATPAARTGAAVAYDQKHDLLVVFGGEEGPRAGGSGVFNDTWTWDGKLWAQVNVSAAGRPPARSGATASYDPSLGVVVHGGRTPSLVGQAGPAALPPAGTWVWDGKTWRLLGDGPQSNAVALAFDPRASNLLTYAQGSPPSAADTWRLTSSHWELVNTPTPYLNQPFLGWDGKRLILVGNPFGPERGQYRSQTWAWQDGAWVQLHAAVDFPYNFTLAGAYHQPTNRIVGVAGGETWTWDGSTWARLHPAHQPAVGSGSGAAYLASKRQVVVFGGQEGGVASNQLWAWDGTDWSRLSGVSPSPVTQGPGTKPTPVPMPASQVAAAVRAGTTGIDPRLVPTYIPAGMSATVVAVPGGLSIEYTDDTHERRLLLAVMLANPPPIGPNGRSTTIDFRGQQAPYRIYDVDNPVAQRDLRWSEPGSYTGTQGRSGGVPYFASSSGITEAEFFKVLNSLDKV